MKLDTNRNGTQYIVVVMLSVIYAVFRKQAYYAECHYSEWRYAERRGALSLKNEFFVLKYQITPH